MQRADAEKFFGSKTILRKKNCITVANATTKNGVVNTTLSVRLFMVFTSYDEFGCFLSALVVFPYYSLILNSLSFCDNLTTKYSSLLISSGSLSLRIEATN